MQRVAVFNKGHITSAFYTQKINQNTPLSLALRPYIKFACHWVSMEIKEKSQQSSYLSHSVSSASILITSKPTGILQVGLEVRLYGLNNSK